MISFEWLREFGKLGLAMSAVAIFGNVALAQTISDFERKFEIKDLQLDPGQTTSVVSARCPSGKAPIGGGAGVLAMTTSDKGSYIAASAPTDEAWEAKFGKTSDADKGPIQVVVTVICAKVK
jgi:hypothetical protein